MSDKEILLERGNFEGVFDFDDVMRQADVVLTNRSLPGREYACLKFIQSYCLPETHYQEWDVFVDRDPRSPNHVKRLAKENWRFELRPVAGNSNEPLGEDIPVTESGGEELLNPENEESVAERECKKLDEMRIAQTFIDYIAQKPFRKYLGDGLWYPLQPVHGWDARLQAYAWPHGNLIRQEANWSLTQETVEQFVERLRTLREAMPTNGQIPRAQWNDAQSIYEDIRLWGNPRGNKLDGQTVANYLGSLWSTPVGTALPIDRTLPIDSTLTKLYAFARADFVIYDTRVAAAIVDVAEDAFRKKNVAGVDIDFLSCFQRHFPNIGHMRQASSSGSSMRRGPRKKWPNAYQNWPAQLDANRLLKIICDQMTGQRIDGRAWTLREVEAVFFMEGY